GIRDKLVTGVQTCALPISPANRTCGCRDRIGATCLSDYLISWAENKVMKLRLEPDLRKRLDGLAKAQRRSWSFIAAEAIREYVEIGRASCRERGERAELAG